MKVPRKCSYQNNTYEVTAEGCSWHPDLALIKTIVTDSVMLRQSNFGKAYGNLVLQATLPGVKNLQSVWLVLVVENVLPLQVDPIQQKKLGFWKFFNPI